MFRTSTLAVLSVLAFSSCIVAPASAQHPHGNPYFTYDHFDSLHGHGSAHHHESHPPYYHGHGDYHAYHSACPIAALRRHRAVSTYDEAICPYGNDAISSEPIVCPLQCGRTYPNQLTDEFQPDFGFETPGHNHSHSGDSHSGHSHEGHSHDGHSHDRQFPSRDAAPSDRGYLAPPTLPRDSGRDFQPEQDFRREQPQRDDSIRMDSPPPSFEPNSPSSPREDNPKRFDVPPPSTV